MALLVVMVLTMLIALGAYRYSFTMQAEYRVTRLHEEQVQARLAALSGLELAAAILENSIEQRDAMGGLGFNPTMFQHISVSAELASTQTTTQQDSSLETWHVSLVTASVGSDESQSPLAATTGSAGNSEVGQVLKGLRFGLENESAKLHVPTLLKWERQFPGHARSALMRLPQAEAGPVDDWLRSQGVSTSGGLSGESRLMDRLQSGTSSSDQRDSQDWFRLQWLGGDFNQNYQLDALELALAESLREDTSGGASGSASGAMSLTGSSSSDLIAPVAWQRYLSWVSGQRNESVAGQPRIYLNDDDLLELHRQLLSIWPTEFADFVIAMRQYGPGQPIAAASSGADSSASASSSMGTTGASASSTAMTAGAWTPDFSRPSSYRLASVLDLVDVSVSVPDESSATTGAGGGASPATSASAIAKKRLLSSPFSSATTEGSNYNERLLDESTVELATSLVGRVDIRHAPLEVLASVPGMDQQLAEQIVQQRSMPSVAASAATPSPRSSIVWLLSEGLVDLARLKQLEPYLTCRSDVYRTQAVGYRDAVSPVYRCTAVIDARQRPAQIVDYQVWHAWDRGFPVESFAPALR
ncbi:MAG: hypothetical protein R3C09_09125 [Pirellulaceae bacterium]